MKNEKQITRKNGFAPWRILAIAGVASASLSTAVLAADKSATPAKPNTAADSFQQWDDRLFSEMQQFENRIDGLFNDVRQMENADKSPGNFNSSVKISDEPSQYVVRFALPNTEMEKAKVTLKDGILHLTANEQSETFSQWQPAPTAKSTDNKAPEGQPSNATIHYEQIIALPGSVDPSTLKVQRSAGLVTVTVEKLGGSATPSTETKK